MNNQNQNNLPSGARNNMNLKNLSLDECEALAAIEISNLRRAWAEEDMWDNIEIVEGDFCE